VGTAEGGEAVMRLAVAIAWLAVGSYALWTATRNRAYIESLPKTRGNNKIRRQRIWILVFGVVALAIGVANYYRWAT
jgi:hypothetical protein